MNFRPFLILLALLPAVSLCSTAQAAQIASPEWDNAMERFHVIDRDRQAAKEEAKLSEVMAEWHRREVASQRQAQRTYQRGLPLVLFLLSMGFSLLFGVLLAKRKPRGLASSASAVTEADEIVPLRAELIASSYLVSADKIALTRDSSQAGSAEEVTQTIMVPRNRRYLAQKNGAHWSLFEMDRHQRVSGEVGKILVGSRVRGSVLGRPHSTGWFELKTDDEWTEVFGHGKCVLSVKQQSFKNSSKRSFSGK